MQIILLAPSFQKDKVRIVALDRSLLCFSTWSFKDAQIPFEVIFTPSTSLIFINNPRQKMGVL